MAYSVLFPVCGADCPNLLAAALKSLCQQTLPPGEVLLVNDGPLTEQLEQVIATNATPLPLRRLGHDRNQGLAATLNLGLQHCRFEQVARMDADDICTPERLERQFQYLQAHPEVDVVGTFVVEIDRQGNLGAERRMPESHQAIMSRLWTCPLMHPTVMFRKSAIAPLGGYDTSLRRRQDYELWFRCAQQGLVFANIPQVLLYYRFDPGSHKKQPSRLALQQGLIGYRGSKAMGLAYWKRLACFIPFLRSLLPGRVEHLAYNLLRRFDPRAWRS